MLAVRERVEPKVEKTASLPLIQAMAVVGAAGVFQRNDVVSHVELLPRQINSPPRAYVAGQVTKASAAARRGGPTRQRGGYCGGEGGMAIAPALNEPGGGSSRWGRNPTN